MRANNNDPVLFYRAKEASGMANHEEVKSEEAEEEAYYEEDERQLQKEEARQRREDASYVARQDVAR